MVRRTYSLSISSLIAPSIRKLARFGDAVSVQIGEWASGSMKREGPVYIPSASTILSIEIAIWRRVLRLTDENSCCYSFRIPAPAFRKQTSTKVRTPSNCDTAGQTILYRRCHAYCSHLRIGALRKESIADTACGRLLRKFIHDQPAPLVTPRPFRRASCVTAPPVAWATNRAYFWRRPGPIRGGGLPPCRCRPAPSLSSIIRSMRRAPASILIRSPSLHQRPDADD